MFATDTADIRRPSLLCMELCPGVRSAATAQSYDPAPSRSSFGQHGKSKGMLHTAKGVK